MKLPFHIIEQMKRKSGNDLRLPSDCEYLSLDILGKTGVRIGATTLKRLLGFAPDERTPHASTLDAIGRGRLMKVGQTVQQIIWLSSI